MEHNYKPLKGGYIKKARGRLNNAARYNKALEGYVTFFQCLNEYCKVSLSTFGILRDANASYLNFLHIIRLLTDAIYKIYGLILANEPDTYISYFMEGKDTNKLKHNTESLTTSTIGKYIGEEYEGIDTLYFESNYYLHPSRFILPMKKRIRGIISRQSKWVNKKIDKELDNELRRDYFIDALNKILLDVTIQAYNRAIVPRYPELKAVDYVRDLDALRINKDNFKAYIAYRMSENDGE